MIPATHRILLSWALTAALPLCLTSPTPAGEPDCLSPAGVVPLAGVEGRLDHFAVDPDSRLLFVAALENHTVEVIDLRKKERVKTLRGINEPQGLAFIPGSRRLLVCCRGDGTCRSFDAESLEEGPWIDLGKNADNIRLDAGANLIYVGSGAEPGPGLISAIAVPSLLPVQLGGKPAEPKSKADLLLDRPRQGDAKAEVVLKAHPESFQVDGENHRIFANVPDDHSVVVIEASAEVMKVAATWPVKAEKNFPLVLDAAGSRLFVVCRKPPCVVVYNTRTGEAASTTSCVGDSDDAFLDARRERLHVIGGEGFVDTFRIPEAAGTAELQRTARTPTAPRARTGLFIPALDLLAVAVPHTPDHPAAVLLFQTDG